MENLSMHIEYLLLRHDCVVVPGIGAFINIHEPARFNRASGIFSPMRREVRFNGALRSDDGLLANSYARKYCLGYGEGGELLRRDIAALLSLIENEGEATIGNIGTLRRTEENTLCFEPRKSASHEARDLGFSPLSIAAGTDNADSAVSPDKQPAKGNSSVPKHDDNGTGRYVERNLDFEKNYYIPVNKTGLKVAACIMGVFMILMLAVYFPDTDNNRMIDRASVVPSEKIIDTARHTLGADSADRNLTSRRTKMDTAAVAEKQDIYYLIVGTFATGGEAESYKEYNSRPGYELEVVPSKRLFRVSVRSSSDRQELINELNSTEFKKNYSEAWIWKR